VSKRTGKLNGFNLYGILGLQLDILKRASFSLMQTETLERKQFDEVLESCRRFLLAIATVELPDDLRAKGGASDLVQQTLAAAIRSENQFRGQTIGELRAWLRAILRSEAAAFRRHFAQTAARDVSLERPLSPLMGQDHQTPLTEVLAKERNRRLSLAIQQLPFDVQQAVILRIEEQLSFPAIGERLGRSEEAARKLFTRGLEHLRGSLSDAADARS
jgi:RNA polymerase sigma-70 factor (ECF subfamily)